MLEELYLIAHLVRGKPAFDVAIKIQIGQEEGWIIPTSGHRAYPFWSSDLWGLISEGTGTEAKEGYLGQMFANPPPNWPDHYQIRSQTPLTKLGQRDKVPNTLSLEDLDL